MTGSLLLGLAALSALVPAALMPPDREDQRELYWLLLGVAAAGPVVWVVVNIAAGWPTGIATALWLTVATSAVLFGGLAVALPSARRLTPLLMAYLFVLGVLGLLWLNEPSRPLPAAVPPGWLGAHIVLALIAYGLLTLGAVAGTGVVLQERAMKAKRRAPLGLRLPAVAEGEELQVRLLFASEGMLGAALVSGMAIEWIERHALLRLDHKTLLSLAAFVLIAALLYVHYRGGLSGRRAARLLLAAYLLVTLAYPGVKFVTDVLVR